MPVFRLTEEIIFPPPHLAEKDGLLAVGGDLSEPRLLLAYTMGIFPWYSKGSPILWWAPDPRLILPPAELKTARSLNQTIKKDIFKITMDTAFESVIKNCAEAKRKGQRETWITPEMIDAYVGLHHSGYAHSVESWFEGELAGGLYGVSLGSAFFGESMFSKMSNASKVAFAALVEKLIEWDFTLIDCQITTAHLKNFGAREVSRKEFLEKLESALKIHKGKGKWEL